MVTVVLDESWLVRSYSCRLVLLDISDTHEALKAIEQRGNMLLSLLVLKLSVKLLPIIIYHELGFNYYTQRKSTNKQV